MGIKMEFDEGIGMDQSPDSVLPAPRHFPGSEKRSRTHKLPRRDEILRINQGFTEISFRHYRSSSCKNFSSIPLGMGDRMEQRRGSVYQSSKELLREERNPKSIEVRGNIELLRSNNASFSFRILDHSKAECRETRLRHDFSSEPCASDDSFIDICLNSGIKDRAMALDSNDEPNFRLDEAASPLSEYNDRSASLPKSLSAKIERTQPSPSGTDHCNRESSRVQFGHHIKKMFDPFVKSKSLRSPLGYIGESGEFKVECKDREKDHHKSLLSDNSNVHKKLSSNIFVTNKDHALSLKSSPVHLHGRLKLESKDGLPVFVFFLDSPEDVCIAKIWKYDKGFNWVYTFSTAGSRKKSNASLRGSNDCGWESSMLGQMQVSCYMYSELRKDGQDPENFMVTEFVLYDTAHARRSVSTQNPTRRGSKNSARLGLDLGSKELNDGSCTTKQRLQSKSTSESCVLDASNSKELIPWPVTDLHPYLEIAAIVMQDPIEKRESLKYKRGDKRVLEKKNLLSFSIIEEGKKDSYRGAKEQEKLKVVIPKGNHGISNSENCGPLPLLQRWRLGGGCDCGGWDMACPLIVFGNPNVQCSHNQPPVDDHQPVELFVQGAKESAPALSMSLVEEGQYDVHFHAELSTLQAFSICVAILHNTEFSSNCRNGEKTLFTHCNSLKMLIDDQVKSLVEAVTEAEAEAEEEEEEEEKEVAEPMKSSTLRSYLFNPPFSPISRV